MELHEIVKEKFGTLNKESLRVVIMAMSPCEDGIEWFDENFDGNFAAVPIEFLSWFAAPYLRWADLSGADLSGADLRDADLRWAYLIGARYDEHTQWPNGFDYAEAVQ